MLTKALKRILALTLTVATALASSAQMRLPKAHQQDHNKLLADQGKPTSSFRLESNNRLLQDIREREAAMDNEVFSRFWNSEHVNAYGSAITVPDHKNINVADFHFPLKSSRITSHFGYRSSFGRMHYGTDLALNVGDTVRAAFPGKIRLTKYEGRGYGYYVVMRHPNGMETVYGHLSRFLVRPNQAVKAGDPIALGGNTGRSTGPHLHFECRYMGMPINPTAIVDFENKVPHRDIFAFNKATAGKGQHYGPSTSKSKRSYASRSKHKKSKKHRRR